MSDYRFLHRERNATGMCDHLLDASSLDEAIRDAKKKGLLDLTSAQPNGENYIVKVVKVIKTGFHP